MVTPDPQVRSSPTHTAPRLLLINPCPPESFWSFQWALDKILVDERATNPPLGLATLAALCPSHWQVQIADEAVEALPEKPEADIVGVCGMGAQHPRQRELLEYYRTQGYFTVAGGSFASLCPEQLDGLADCVVAGEAEYIWPQFCRDYEAGDIQPRYEETGAVDLNDVPVPRFDLLNMNRYGIASLQFSRGCPYRCEFCDIIVMFGRKPRTKAPEQIGRELDALLAAGNTNAFFVDDNLIGNKKVAKELLRYLADYQEKRGYPLVFGTEASLNLATDQELLELFRDAGFAWVFLGIETPDVESLKAAGKTQNTKTDLLESVRTIYSYGIDVYAGFIVGFDNDTVEAFEAQYHFIVNAGIQVSMVGLLTALPRTPLYERLEAAGRVRHDIMPGDNTRGQTNVLPANMSYQQMIAGYKKLYARLFSNKGIAARIRNKTRWLRRPIGDGHSERRMKHVQLLGRMLLYGIAPGGPSRWAQFLSTLWCPPKLWPAVLTDWVRGLSMRHYANHWVCEPPPRVWRHAQRTLARLHRRFRGAFAQGELAGEIVRDDDAPHLIFTLRGPMDERFVAQAGRRFRRLLRQPRVSLTLRIEHGYAQQRAALNRLLESLDRYGERVTVQLHEQVRPYLNLNASRLQVRGIAPP